MKSFLNLERLTNSVFQSYDRLRSFLLYNLEIILETIQFYSQWKINRKILYRQILFTGFEALGIITLIAIVIGGLIILEGNSILTNFGQSKLLFTILVSVITRELGCVLTAFIVTARSGTAIATELGNMVVNQEIEALQSFGISPISYLVLPRLLGVIISIMTLSIYFNVAALFGGWVIASLFYPINFIEFMNSLFQELIVADIILSLLKSFIFGYIIASVSSYQGLQVSFARTEVPQRTIKAVVFSLSGVIVADIILTLIYYFY
jgi:phospholipid/cholesterol/gamma-HCH transport system permease protein